MIRPSAPAATAARAIGTTMSRRPAPWLGSALAQQGEVLHVVRAHLEDVGVAVDQLDLADVHHLGDELHVFGVRCVAKEPQPFLAEPLEAVRRAARLERAAAENLRSGAARRRRRRPHLFFVFSRARPGRAGHVVAAVATLADRYDRAPGPAGPARR